MLIKTDANGNYLVSQEELKLLLKHDRAQHRGELNPQRLKVIWIYLNSVTEDRKPPLTKMQYERLLKVTFKNAEAGMWENIEKFIFAFDTANEYARGVGKGTFHYYAELYNLKANLSSYTLIRVLESLTEAKRQGHPEGMDTLLRDEVFSADKEGSLKDHTAEDGRVYFTYAGKTKEDILEDMKRSRLYLLNNQKSFKEDILGMEKYLSELIPPRYLEPFENKAINLFPLKLIQYIRWMQDGFLKDTGIPIEETSLGGKRSVFPTFDGVEVANSKIDYQYKAYKEIVEIEWLRKRKY